MVLQYILLDSFISGLVQSALGHLRQPRREHHGLQLDQGVVGDEVIGVRFQQGEEQPGRVGEARADGDHGQVCLLLQDK
jgi:hypothetical protein